MHKLAVVLCLAAAPALAANPPDWYGHIPASQQAALLAARQGGAAGTAIGSGSPLPYREPVLVAYAAPPSLDLTTIGASNLTLEHHRQREARVRRILRQFRQPDVYEPLTVRGAVRGQWLGTRHLGP